MLRLENKTRNIEVVRDVRIAASFWERSKGLLGTASLSSDQALWIQGSEWMGCNSIHTFFMAFPIDAVFVDRDLCVRKVYRHLRPWRMTWPVANAHSVFEFAAGTLDQRTIQTGDRLYVGD